MAIKNINTDLQIEAGLRDGDGDLGTNNQVLISTGTGINWIDGSGTGIIGGPYLPLAGGGMTGTLVIGSQQLKFSDAGRFFMGDSNDLQIYHDGSNSYIKDTGTGNLRIDATNFFVRNSDGSKLAIDAVDGAEVNLRYNGSKKFETTNTGVTVTGQTISSAAFISNAIDSGNPQATSDQLRLSGYGIMGNRGTVYFTNALAAGSIQFGVGGAHAANPQLEIDNTSATFTNAVTAPTFLGDLGATSTINTGVTAVTKPNATDDTTVATTAFVQNLIGTIPAGLVFQGTWNADTNTPTLVSGTGTTGHFYIVSTDGSTNLDGITDWKVGDWAVFVEQGATDAWEKVDNSSVLDGSGTGNTVPLWAGSGTSNTLGNSIITQTGASPNQIIRITSNADAQLRLDGAATSYAGIHWVDNNGGDYMWFNGSTSTFAIGGGSSAVSGKKLHIDGSTSIGSNYDAVSPPTNGLVVEGNVGIGTTSPGEKLEISGNVKLADNNKLLLGTGSDLEIYHDGSNSYINQTGTGKIIIQSTSGINVQSGTGETRFTYSGVNSEIKIDDSAQVNKVVLKSAGNSYFNGGNVGIGTTNPTSKLTISSDIAGDGSWDDSGILINNTATGATGESALVFKNAGPTGTGTSYWFTGLNQSTEYRLAYGTSFSNANSRLTLGAGGTLTLNTYGTGARTGTAAYNLSVDSSGNVIESTIGGVAPATPGNITSTIVGETIEIEFDESITSNIDYYQVWSSDDGGDFGIIAQITPTDFSSTMTVVDTTFVTGGTMSYRVYAVKSGVYSSPGTTSIVYTVGTLDVTDMTVINLNTAYYIQYEKPASRFIDHIEIYMDSQTTQGALNRSNASIVYSGQNPSYMRSVGVSNNFHQFWVEVVTT